VLADIVKRRFVWEERCVSNSSVPTWFQSEMDNFGVCSIGTGH